VVSGQFQGISKDGLLRSFRDIQGSFLKDFKEYRKVVFQGLSGIPEDGSLRVFKDIQGRLLKDFKEDPRMVLEGF
jgi:hypothetical protein